MNSRIAHPDMPQTILLVNGPNLNLLGEREPELYGSQTLAEIVSNLQHNAATRGFKINALQTNSESEIVNSIQDCRHSTAFILMNAGAYTHTSIAIRDALLAVSIPFIEIHLSNVFSRDHFRHRSYLSDIAIGLISGFGPYSYTLALEAAMQHLESREES